MSWNNEVGIESFKDKVFVRVELIGDDEIHFEDSDGGKFKMYHDQDCCEHVYVESIVGELTDLIGNPILLADLASSNERPKELPVPEYEDDSQTWTFYRLATIKGYVDIRWYGSSNGYYSESVTIEKME
jgi:hypothetical protein